MKKLVSLVFIFFALALGSCRYLGGERVKGNGNITSQKRDAGQFRSIDVGGAVKVIVRQDSFHAIRVETDDNLHEYVEVVDDGEILRIHSKSGYNLDPSKDILVYVSSPIFKDFHVTGASSLISENKIISGDEVEMKVTGASNIILELNSPKIFTELSGASNITLKGETKDLTVEGSGACHLKGFDLMAESVQVDISGASKADVYASVKLDAHASGASEIKYKGNAQANSNTSGASSVSKVN